MGASTITGAHPAKLTPSVEPEYIGHLPPRDVESERATLGSILIDRDAIHEVIDFLRPEDFYDPRSRLIYTAMLRLYEDGKPPNDEVLVVEDLERHDELDAAGGASYLSQLVLDTPTAVHVVQYAAVVQRKAELRRTSSAAASVIEAINGGAGKDELDFRYGNLQAAMSAVASRPSDMTRAVASGVTLEEFVAGAASGPSWLLPGRIPDQGITLFAGEPRTFKTWTVLQYLLCVAVGESFLDTPTAKSGRVLYVSEEGARAKLAERLGRLAGNIQPPVGSVRIMHRTGVQFATGEGWDRVRDTVAAERPVLVAFDTLAALMVGDENSVRDMNDALRHVQRLIADFGVTAILLHHLNKNGDGRPGKRLRGSTALWGAVDCVWSFTRDTLNGLDQNAGTILIEPKDGDIERVRFTWDPETFLLSRDAAPRCTPQGIFDVAVLLTERGERATADALQTEFPGTGRSWFREQLAKAVQDGLLTRSGATRSLVYRPVEPDEDRTNGPDETIFGGPDE